MGTQIKLAFAFMLTLGAGVASFAQTHTQRAHSGFQGWVDDPFFQFTSAVADCPQPLGPFVAESARAAVAREQAEKSGAFKGSADAQVNESAEAFAHALAQAVDAEIAAQLKAAFGKGQLYTHSPLVNSSLWATVQGRIVTIEGCISGDIPAGFDHALIRSQIETLVSAVPKVLKVVVLIRTSAQQRANEAVPYRLRPTF